jgi:hypothetical protein
MSNKKGSDAMAYVFETLPAQRSRIDMGNPSEVIYWSKIFGCSEQQLRQAVAKVGDSSAMVEQPGHPVAVTPLRRRRHVKARGAPGFR